ncbi:hypothetical protein BJ508DRAFT_415798 [Ascobolus immersus RN42]|uniref:Extracellular membrane protein CFEM domain-containing protein n=1 Tax=Ascobolus immersus RN42 TaxID=1160509 RepID=A0A3N4I0K7_ASCIM|nr:hypothetical protein BJ508DRAFT_415798 [Ascobolus immersus RN42]
MKFFTAVTTFFALAASSVIAAPTAQATKPSLEHTGGGSSICSAPTGSCNFYSICLEGQYQCGSSGYPLGYGKKYCDKFSANRSNFSSKGKTWVDKTMLCLQKKLVSHAKGGSTCTKIKNAAFASHSTCYVQSGLCDLSVADFKQILSTVDLADMFGGKANLIEVIQSAASCASKFLVLL